MRATLAHANIDAIVSGLIDTYAFMHMNDPPRHQLQQGQTGRGRFQRRFPHGSVEPQGAGVAPMASANGPGGERVCYNCGEPGHIRDDCRNLHAAVRGYLKQQGGSGGYGRGRSRGRGRGGPAIAAVYIPDLQSIVDSLPGEKSVLLPHNWLVDSGAEKIVCFQYNQFCRIGPSDVDQCVLVGSALIDVLGKGTVRFCAGIYVDYEGMSHSSYLETGDVYWIPQCPINLLTTESLRKQNMYLYTSPRGNESNIPGFADQGHGRHGAIDQKGDANRNSTLEFCLGDGRPVK